MVEQVKTKTEPYVRFRGFDDEWEQVKLGDVATLKNGYSFKSDLYTDEGSYKILTIGNITGETYIDITNTKIINRLPENIQEHQILSIGDILISMTGNVGRVSMVDVEDTLLNQRVGLIDIGDTVDRTFMYQVLSSPLFEANMVDKGQGAAQMNIGKSDIESYRIYAPSLDEQQKIGELFQTLDKAIDLSNTQVANLKQQKKALLQRLFPQKGETEPKVRLRGFTDEWDSSLLLDEIEVYQPKSLPQSKFLDEGYPVYGANGMIGYYDEYNHENRQIAMACRGNTAGVVNIIPEQSYITGNAMIMDVYTNDKLDFNFMGQLFNNFDFTPYISGSGQPQITRSALKGAYIQLPSLEEQQAIGELFQTLDEQISQAEDKVSQYKELKQALLQRLFV